MSNIEKRLRDHDEVLTNQRVDLLSVQDTQEVIKNKIVNLESVTEKSDNSTNTSKVECKKKEQGDYSSTLTKKEQNFPVNVYKRRCLSENDLQKLTTDTENFGQDICCTNHLDKNQIYDCTSDDEDDEQSNTPTVNAHSFKSRVFTTSRKFSEQKQSYRKHHSRQRHEQKHFRGAPEPQRDIFVYRVKYRSELDIASYCKKKGILVRDCTLLSHPAAKFKSFKISVLLGQANLVLNYNFWPKGIKAKRFVDRKKESQIIG